MTETVTRSGRRRWLVGGLTLALLASILIACLVGSAQVSPAEAMAVLADHLTGRSQGIGSLAETVVWELRLPRALTACLVGAGLAVSGAVMQSLTRNPLADPYLLGLSSGATLGAVVVLQLGLTVGLASRVALPAAAFGGALLALGCTLTIASLGGGGTAPARTVLAGIAVSQFFSAVASLVIFWTATGDSYRSILTWLLGSLAGSTWSTTVIGVVALALTYPAVRLSAGVLDTFALGDTAASALGINVSSARLLLSLTVALLTGAMVSLSGAIGFVGLILPHLVRGVTGGLHRFLLPATAVGGALFLLWADTAARTIAEPRELPVGIVTAVVGVPVFVLLLTRRGGAPWR